MQIEFQRELEELVKIIFFDKILLNAFLSIEVLLQKLSQNLIMHKLLMTVLFYVFNIFVKLLQVLNIFIQNVTLQNKDK